MGLTRIRAEQISDIDYKQSVRVITLSNITLSGGAPSTVDGINLAAFDRILVAGQSTGSQNGLYEVQTLGTGSNGTWIRTSDGNATGEISAGMIVMVTEGDTYKDTQWKLTTNDPITVGSTALVFEQSSAYAFGIISANSTTISADSVGDTLTITPGLGVRVIGDAVSDTITLAANIAELVSGSNYQIQYNNNGVFGGASKFIYDNSNGRVIANAELAATSTSTGTFIVQGGSAVTGNLYVGGLLDVVGNVANAVTARLATGNDNNFRITAQNGVASNGTGTEVGRLGLNYAGTGWDSFTQYIRGSAAQNGAQVLWAANTAIANVNSTGVSVTGIVGATGNVSGGNLTTAGQISASGTIFSTGTTNGTGFAVGNAAVSNVALGFFPTAGTRADMAIRDYSTVFSSMYFDVGMGGSAGGEFRFRLSNAFTDVMTVDSTGITTTNKVSGATLATTQSSGDEGGEISMALAATNTSLSGNIVIDVYQNKLRFFEGGGTSRGAYIDLSQASAGVGTNLLAGGGGTPGGSDTYVQFNDGGVFGGNAQFTYNKTTNVLTAGIIAASNNGNGTNFKVGDDAYIGDVNTADTISIRGQQSAANGYIVFGNNDTTAKLGRSGSGPLTYAGAFTLTGTLTGTTINAAAIGNSGATLTGTIQTASQTNITGLGNVTTGTWSATAVGLAYGGTGATTAATARTNLGATTVGANFFTLANPDAITFPRMNADNSVSALSAADFRTAIGAGTSSTTGTVTSIAAGSYLTGGTITTSGTLAVDATSVNTASKVVARDASGNFAAGTITATLSGSATSAATWTTGRTLTIGSTGKSVNGSGDVSWSLSEIGLGNVTNLSLSNYFNNTGDVHSARTSFDATTPSYDFGYRYVQGSTNGPGTGGSQFYSWYIGLGSQYPATGAGSYGAMFAVDRNVTTPYMSVRYNESNSFSSWRKVAAGYADSAGSVTQTLTRGSYLTGSNYNGSGATTWAVDATTTNTASKIVARDASGNFAAGTITATATSAKYADLAEKYLSDADYAPGTVVVFGGTKEITVSDQSHDTRIAGVISTDPAYLMNSESTGLPVAFTGRVPCLVQGPVAKGDVLVNSTTAGIAMKIVKGEFEPGCVLGKALDEITTNEIKTIEVVVGRF